MFTQINQTDPRRRILGVPQHLPHEFYGLRGSEVADLIMASGISAAELNREAANQRAREQAQRDQKLALIEESARINRRRYGPRAAGGGDWGALHAAQIQLSKDLDALRRDQIAL